jgi:hypothetical protein
MRALSTSRSLRSSTSGICYASRDNGYEWAESALEDVANELAAVKDEAEKTGVESPPRIAPT